MKQIILIAMLAMMASGNALAEKPSNDLKPQVTSEKRPYQGFHKMTPAQKKAFYEQVKAKWDALPPADKQAFKDKMEEEKRKREETMLVMQYGKELLKKGEIQLPQ
jgi:hypothetical protein